MSAIEKLIENYTREVEDPATDEPRRKWLYEKVNHLYMALEIWEQIHSVPVFKSRNAIARGLRLEDRWLKYEYKFYLPGTPLDEIYTWFNEFIHPVSDMPH